MGTLATLAAAISDGRTSSVAAVARALDAIEASQQDLNAFTVVDRDAALVAAKDADSSAPRGPLHGVPVAVKDLFDVAGWTTSGCSHAYAGRVAADDAAAVAALRAAGAIVVGKTNMHELAFGATGDVSAFGPANNPWDPARMAGGSSSGSAVAVAAGLVPVALGTDTGGSVRIPASLCGVSALKTTHGLVPFAGVMPLAPTFDTVGPIAEDADDLALAMRALAGIGVAWRDDLDGLVVGRADNRSFDTVDPAVAAGVDEAIAVFESAGARIVDATLPDAERARDTWTDVALPEFLRAHAGIDLSLLSDELRFLVEAARLVGEDAERDARRAVADVAAAWARSFETVDAIVLPATPVAAPLHFAATTTVAGAEVAVHGGLLSSKTRQINLPGIPALSLPCGFDAAGLPFGMQIAGPRGSDARLLAIGRVYQRRTAVHLERPPPR